jgi:hypothetical protein
LRAAFNGLRLSGRNCIDLGTMDGLYAVLMKQAGARDVFAFDRLDRSDRISLSRRFRGNHSTIEPASTSARCGIRAAEPGDNLPIS